MADESVAKKARTEQPESYYKIIDGKKYDRELLECAEQHVKDGQISYAEAKHLVDQAKDGQGITECEKDTLEYSLANHKYTERAKTYVQSILATGKPPANRSYYKIIDGKKYDRELLEMAEGFAKDGQVSFAEARQLWESAQDGKGLTTTEKATLEHVLEHLNWTDKARKAMEAVLSIKAPEPEKEGEARGHSYYKIVDGVKYDRELLEMAEGFAKDGQISYSEAKDLLELAKDGKGISSTEKATLEHTLQALKYTDKAANFMKGEIESGKAGSYYVQVDGVKYDRELLDAAEASVKDGQISEAEAQSLVEKAKDGPGVTACEKRTLQRTLETMKYTDKAKAWMVEALSAIKVTK